MLNFREKQVTFEPRAVEPLVDRLVDNYHLARLVFSVFSAYPKHEEHVVSTMLEHFDNSAVPVLQHTDQFTINIVRDLLKEIYEEKYQPLHRSREQVLHLFVQRAGPVVLSTSRGCCVHNEPELCFCGVRIGSEHRADVVFYQSSQYALELVECKANVENYFRRSKDPRCDLRKSGKRGKAARKLEYFREVRDVLENADFSVEVVFIGYQDVGKSVRCRRYLEKYCYGFIKVYGYKELSELARRTVSA